MQLSSGVRLVPVSFSFAEIVGGGFFFALKLAQIHAPLAPIN